MVKGNIPKRYFVAKALCFFFILISVLVFIYTFHRAEITFQGTRGYVYNKYYILSIASFIFWTFLLKFKDELILNTVLFSTSLLGGIYAVEFSINKLLSSELSKDFDTRTVYEVYQDLLNQGLTAVPSVRPTIFLSTNGLDTGDEPLFPLAGVSNVQTVYCNESGERIIYRSDKYGFRNPPSAWDMSDQKWILVGDSFTQGACVNDNHTISSFIQSFSNEVSVLSLGIGGNGPLIELASIEEYAKHFRPKVLVWMYFEGNDLVSNLPYELKSPLIKNYLKPNFNQNLINRQTEIDTKINKFIKESVDYRSTSILFYLEDFIQNSRTLRLLNIRRILGIDKQKEELDYSSDFRKVLKEAKRRVESWNGKIVFVYLPEYSRYLLKDQDNSNFRKRREVLDIIKNLDIEIVDIHTEVFKKHSDPLSLFPRRSEPHYTPEGYRLTAKAIKDAIE